MTLPHFEHRSKELPVLDATGSSAPARFINHSCNPSALACHMDLKADLGFSDFQLGHFLQFHELSSMASEVPQKPREPQKTRGREHAPIRDVKDIKHSVVVIVARRAIAANEELTLAYCGFSKLYGMSKRELRYGMKDAQLLSDKVIRRCETQQARCYNAAYAGLLACQCGSEVCVGNWQQAITQGQIGDAFWEKEARRKPGLLQEEHDHDDSGNTIRAPFDHGWEELLDTEIEMVDAVGLNAQNWDDMSLQGSELEGVEWADLPVDKRNLLEQLAFDERRWNVQWVWQLRRRR